jgi:hypothetical protein
MGIKTRNLLNPAGLETVPEMGVIRSVKTPLERFLMPYLTYCITIRWPYPLSATR